LIIYLTHKEIDKIRWDDCINHSVNSLPYALSWWLDTVSPGWEALVKGDYEAVMPLTCRRKYGFHYLFQPFYTQQLGIFSPKMHLAKDVNEFLEVLPKECRYVSIQLNYFNNPSLPAFRYTVRRNFILDLKPSYPRLHASYHRNCRRNLQKAASRRLSVKQGPGAIAFTTFMSRYLDKDIQGKRKPLLSSLQHLAMESLQNGTGVILGTYKPDGKMIAAGWFINFPGRCLFMACASAPEGKESHAMALLVDHIIREKAGSGIILDFTGSDLPGVAYFNTGFGSVKTTYLAVKRNLLPWPVRWLKAIS
jgi:hypothetical protein